MKAAIHAEVRANFLASPPLVVAYALVGTMNIDLYKDPLGLAKDGKPVFLKDLWPTSEELAQLEQTVDTNFYRQRYKTVQNISSNWSALSGQASDLYPWNQDSTYIQNPPFFDAVATAETGISDIKNARVLLKLGDSVTTDHISPAGSFAAESPAGDFLSRQAVAPADFNTYGARRGNDRVMMRGTFANIRIRNQLVPGTEGGFTKHIPSGKKLTIFDAASHYQKENTPCIVIAGAEYGSGSSRDWAAKGPRLLGVKAVVAVSFERIHRSNLIGMGILPLQFKPGDNAQSLQLSGEELYHITGLDGNITPGCELSLVADQRVIPVVCRLDTDIEISYYRNGGILHTVLKDIIEENQPGAPA